MFTAGVAVLGCSAKGSDCRVISMVRAFSIALKHSCGFMLSTYMNKAKEALNIADKLSDMILFHSRVRDNGVAMMKPWEA